MRNSKKIVRVIVSIAVVIAVIVLLDFLLYPCTFVRNNIHTMTTEEKDVLIFGTSHGMSNIDPTCLLLDTDLTGQNMCVGGEYPVDAYYMTKLALEKQDPKIIIYEVDYGYFTTEKERGNNYLLFYHEFPTSMSKLQYFAATLLDSDIRFPMFSFHEYSLSTVFKRIPDTVYQKWNKNYDVSYLKSSSQEYHENGFIEKYPVDEADFPKRSNSDFTAEDIRETNMEYLSKLIDLCNENGITFIAVSTPMPDATLQSDPDSAAAASAYFAEFFANEGVPYYDFDSEYYSVYNHNTENYVDYDGHMNGDSARVFSVLLGQTIGMQELAAEVK